MNAHNERQLEMFLSLIRSLYSRNLTKSRSNSHVTVNRSKNQRFCVTGNHAKPSRCEIRLITNIIVWVVVFCGLSWALDQSVLNNNIAFIFTALRICLANNCDIGREIAHELIMYSATTKHEYDT
jgi:hypothetical protein